MFADLRYVVMKELRGFEGKLSEVEAGLVANHGSAQFKVSLNPPLHRLLVPFLEACNSSIPYHQQSATTYLW
jgi:hypothetical protein